MGDSPDKTSEKLQLSLGRKLLKGCVVLSRWMLIILLALILAGGLYFKAPWKVLVLDGVLLALLTIVPKKKRKYGWLTLTAAVLAVTVWIFIPESDSGDWKPYTFEKEINAFNAKYAVPDEDNAAVILERISFKYEDTFYRWPDLSDVKSVDDPNFTHIFVQEFDLRGTEFYPDCWTDEFEALTLQGPWRSKDFPELFQWLKGHNNDIEMLIEASKKPKCQFQYTFNCFRFKFNDDPSYAISEWLNLLKRSANNDWGDGRINEATEKYTALFKLGNLLSRQAYWGLSLGADLQYRHMSNLLSHFILENPLTDAQLNTLEKSIDMKKYELKEHFDRHLEFDQIVLKQICATVYEENENGKIRYNRSFPKEVLKQMKIEVPKRRFEQQEAKLASVVAWFWTPETPQKLAKLIHNAYRPVYQMPESEFDKEEVTAGDFQLNFRSYEIDPLINAQLKVYHCIYKSQAHLKLYENAYQIVIALRRYKNKNGSWPGTLDQLTTFTNNDIFRDPLNGSYLVYQKTDGNFVLYSKGKNGIDEGGSCEDEADDILIWPEELDSTI